jgi:hypothetical protein
MIKWLSLRLDLRARGNVPIARSARSKAVKFVLVPRSADIGQSRCRRPRCPTTQAENDGKASSARRPATHGNLSPYHRLTWAGPKLGETTASAGA